MAEGPIAAEPRTELAVLVMALRPARNCLSRERLERARRYARHRAGRVLFAFADGCGEIAGGHPYRLHASASVIKVMLLVAYLRRHDVRDRRLSRGERATLGAMIKESDNQAASEVFAIVGESGLRRLARAVGMRRFRTSSSWGDSGITAGDQAGFVRRLERYLPPQHDDYPLEAMARITPSQRWGITEVAPAGWGVHFKSGWYPVDGSTGWRVNQIATLRRGRRSISLAVLSDNNSSFGYGRETIRGVERLLLRRLPPLSGLRAVEALEQHLQHAGGGSPDEGSVDLVRRGPEGDAAPEQPAHRVALAKPA